MNSFRRRQRPHPLPSAAEMVLLAGALATVLLSAGGCSGGDEPPNIVIVVLDTVRDDVPDLARGRVSDPMPALGALEREGTSFANTWATAPWTLPSHASLFTGLLPSGHTCNGRSPQLAAEHRTMAEYLGEAGYEAAAFFSNPWLSDEMSGVMRGFESRYVESRGDYRVHYMKGSQGGAASNKGVAEWLEGRSGDRPFLLFVNYLESHLPFDPGTAFREAYLSDLDPDDVVTTTWAYEFNAGLHDYDGANWERINRLYVGDASTADALLAELVGILKEHGLYDEAVIIVTSDHGENLGDHGLMDHQFGIFETLLAVPLVVRAPGILEQGVREDPIMLTDLLPTVLEIAGIDDLPELPHAHSVLASPSSADRPIIAEYAGGNAALIDRLQLLNPELDTTPLRSAYASVRVGNLRLTIGSDGSNRIDDYATDPDEMVDIRSEGRAIAAALRVHLPAVGAPAGNIEVNDEMREELRSLGYLP